MDPVLLRAFRFEVHAQSQIAFAAWNQLTDLAKKFVPTLTPKEMAPMMDQALPPFQGFIVAAGVISLIVFPRPRKPASAEGQRALARGVELRQLWEVPDDSPLANRNLRNSLEHIDERLEEWIDSTKPVRFSPFAIVPNTDYLHATGGDSIRVFIGTIPWRFVVYGEEQNVEVLVQAIKELRERLGTITTTFEGRNLS